MFILHLRRLYILKLLGVQYVSVKCSGLIVWFKYCISFIILCLGGLPIIESGILRFPAVICEFSNPCFISVSFCCTYFENLLLNAYTYFYNWSQIDHFIPIKSSSSLLITFVLNSILSDSRINTPALFSLSVAWVIFFHHCIFNIFVSLNLKCFNHIQHIVESCCILFPFC